MSQQQEVLFLSDLHISFEKKDITRHFLNFLQHRALQAQAVYILGDLFDAWVGDDDNTHPNKTIKQSLKALVDAGIQVFLHVGNRDFLIGQDFARQTGVTLLGDYQVIDLFGTPTLLTHGDLLCSDDEAYQDFRKKSRTEQWQQNVLSKPLWLRLLAARWYRMRSHYHKKGKNQDIMDVNQGTVEQVMREHGCTCLIHGHTHRPAVHDFKLDDKPAQRIVLTDWQAQKAEVLCCREDGFQRVDLT